MKNCFCGGTPKLKNGNGIGAYYYLCEPCDIQAVSGLSKEIAEKAWDVLMDYGSKNEPALL